MTKTHGLFIALAASLTTSVAAQQPPTPPASAPRPAQSARPAVPERIPDTPRAPRAALAPMPTISAWELPDLRDIQGRIPSPEEIARITEEAMEMAQHRSRMDADMAREMARLESEMAREHARVQSDMVREQARVAADQARVQSEMAREQTRMATEMARDQARVATEMALTAPHWDVMPALAGGTLLSDRPPAAWAQRDPADSLWRAANEVMNKGDYRRAAALFKEIPVKYQYSAYAADAMYWQAHALYRVGSTPDLQDALAVLEQLKQKYPTSRLRGSQADVAALKVRIAGVLAARGQGGSEIVRQALANNANVCDREEQQIRAAALNALMQTDQAAATDYAQKMLARNDDCSRELRRSAVFLIGNKGDPASTATLISVAKNDASRDVRQAAVQYLGRMPGDNAVAALEELARSDTSQLIQREAIRQLARSTNARARSGIKALVERNDMPESLRISALDALNPEQSTQEDVAWLQATYSKVESPRIRSRIISAMARIGGAQNEKWFMTLANNESESIDVRVEALRRAGQAMEIAALGRLYDQTGQRQLRYELVRQLGSRREPESIDKLGEIAKTGTDPEVRTRAIEALMSKKDDRATKLVLQLIDRP